MFLRLPKPQKSEAPHFEVWAGGRHGPQILFLSASVQPLDVSAYLVLGLLASVLWLGRGLYFIIIS